MYEIQYTVTLDFFFLGGLETYSSSRSESSLLEELGSGDFGVKSLKVEESLEVTLLVGAIGECFTLCILNFSSP